MDSALDLEDAAKISRLQRMLILSDDALRRNDWNRAYHHQLHALCFLPAAARTTEEMTLLGSVRRNFQMSIGTSAVNTNLMNTSKIVRMSNVDPQNNGFQLYPSGALAANFSSRKATDTQHHQVHDVPKLVVNWNQPAIGVVTSTRNVPSRVRVGVTDADDATASVPVISSSSPPLPGDYLPGQRSACENQPTTNFRAKETASSRLVGVANIDHPNQIPYQEPQTPSTNSHTSYMNMWSDAAAGTNSGSWGHNRPLAYVMRHAEFTTSTDPDPSRSGYASARNVDGARCGQAGDPSSHLGAGSGLRSLSEWPTTKRSRGDFERRRGEGVGGAGFSSTSPPPGGAGSRGFVSSLELLEKQQRESGGDDSYRQYAAQADNPSNQQRTLPVPRNIRRPGRGGFVPPFAQGAGQASKGAQDDSGLPPAVLAKLLPDGGDLPESLKQLDPQILERVCSEIIEGAAGNIHWDSIAGLELAKETIKEVVVWPMINPKLFTGSRAPPKGVLLFGPPGTGKTLIGRAIATECGATFFSISASSLTSKWIGEGEKMVRCLFAVARHLQPSVIFIDEIDALLSARKSEGEHESSRRMKNEFLVQMEGTDEEQQKARVLLVGATNRPQELDEAARRRLPKQMYIPLPCAASRQQLLHIHLGRTRHALQQQDFAKVVHHTAGYSGSDLRHVVQEAANIPLRELSRNGGSIVGLTEDAIRPIQLDDMRKACKHVRPSVKQDDVLVHEEWNLKHGARIELEDGDDGEW